MSPLQFLLILSLLSLSLSSSPSSSSSNPTLVSLVESDHFGHRNFKSAIHKGNADKINVTWKATMCGPGLHTPLVTKDWVLQTDLGACITKYDRKDGHVVQRVNLTQFGFPQGLYARAEPVRYKGNLIFFTGSILTPIIPGIGAYMFALRESNLSLAWNVQVDAFPWDTITQASSVDLENGVVYFGMSSGEFAASLYPNVQCCYFGGGMYAYNLTDGSRVWKRDSIPAALRGVNGYGGASTWSGRPLIVNDRLYYCTGQLYQVPTEVAACINANPNNGSCIHPDVLYNSVVAVNRFTGAYIAHYRTSVPDVWNALCFFAPSLCPTPQNALDFDMTTVQYSKSTNTLYSASKSGTVYGFDYNLNLRWSNTTAYGSASGGVRYANALVDGDELSLYVSSSNGNQLNFTLPSGKVSSRGVWVKYDKNGNIKWITEAPLEDGQTTATTSAAVSVTNDVVVGHYQPKFNIVAGVSGWSSIAFLDRETGAILSSIKLSAQTGGAPAIVGKYIYTPTGVLGASGVIEPCDLYALSIGGNDDHDDE